MAQQDPNRNPEVLRVTALEHANEESYRIGCQTIGLELANQEWMTHCAWQQQNQNNDLLHAQNAGLMTEKDRLQSITAKADEQHLKEIVQRGEEIVRLRAAARREQFNAQNQPQMKTPTALRQRSGTSVVRYL